MSLLLARDPQSQRPEKPRNMRRCGCGHLPTRLRPRLQAGVSVATAHCPCCNLTLLPLRHHQARKDRPCPGFLGLLNLGRSAVIWCPWLLLSPKVQTDAHECDFFQNLPSLGVLSEDSFVNTCELAEMEASSSETLVSPSLNLP